MEVSSAAGTAMTTAAPEIAETIVRRATISIVFP
jgi:hypothetical protein